MNVIHYAPAIKKTDGSLDMTLVKKLDFRNLRPYGKFKLTDAIRPKKLPNIIPISELVVDYDSMMPLDAQQDKEVIKLMKSGKTEILCENDGYLSFYTRIAGGFTHISHPKLVMYREDDAFRAAIDNGDSFAMVMLNSR